MKRIIPTLFCFLQICICLGQQQKTRNLSVGDTVPDIEIKNILNFSSNVLKISSFKGKLLILDFWATWCSPCIASFPKLDALQKKFGDKLQILAVTDEKQSIVKDFFERLKKLNNIPSPTSVTDDVYLSRLFFHTTIPHYVWIGKDGKVIAITESKNVTEENINSYFREGKFNFSLKEDESGQITMEKDMPIFVAPSVIFEKDGKREIRRLDSSRLTVHSLLTKYIQGAGYGLGSFPLEGYILYSNTTMLNLYRTAIYGNAMRTINHHPSTLIVEVPDSALYKHISAKTLDGKELGAGMETEAWLRENGYCYELKVPPVLADQRFKIMLDQLNLYFSAVFGIEGLVEKRMNKYLALVRTSNEDKIKATIGGEENIIYKSIQLKLENSTTRQLVLRLVQPLQRYPMIEDETGYTGKINIEVNCQLYDLKALNKELSKYDLQIVEKEKIMDVGVIRMKAANQK